MALVTKCNVPNLTMPMDPSLDVADVAVATRSAFHEANIAPATTFDDRQRGWLIVAALVVAYPPESLATFLVDGH
jgi:hypothetical protein